MLLPGEVYGAERRHAAGKHARHGLLRPPPLGFCHRCRRPQPLSTVPGRRQGRAHKHGWVTRYVNALLDAWQGRRSLACQTTSFLFLLSDRMFRRLVATDVSARALVDRGW